MCVASCCPFRDMQYFVICCFFFRVLCARNSSTDKRLHQQQVFTSIMCITGLITSHRIASRFMDLLLRGDEIFFQSFFSSFPAMKIYARRVKKQKKKYPEKNKHTKMCAPHEVRCLISRSFSPSHHRVTQNLAGMLCFDVLSTSRKSAYLKIRLGVDNGIIIDRKLWLLPKSLKCFARCEAKSHETHK